MEAIDFFFGVFLLLFVKQLYENSLVLFINMLNLNRREEEDYPVEYGDENGHRLARRLLYLSPAPFPTRRPRQLWMKVLSRDWWDRIVLTEFNDDDWKENFRMYRASFVKLYGLVEDFMSLEEATVRAPIPIKMRVAIVLYRLGSCGEYRVVANQFGVHKATVMKCVHLFCKAVVDEEIMRNLIRMPNEQEAVEIARRFEATHQIPQIFGLIDGTHIQILPPSDGYRDFVNRKGWPSYVLQAVVDNRFMFRNISCKMPGCAHDSMVFQNSDLFRRAHLLPRGVRNIEGEDVRLQIVGDPAYPLLDWLIKGYQTSPNLTAEQESFNVYLSSVRVGVEQTFGFLKSRFRILSKKSEFHYTFTPKMIATCCVLHNFYQQERDRANPNWVDETYNQLYPQPARAVIRNDAADNRARQALTRHVARHFPLRRGHLH